MTELIYKYPITSPKTIVALKMPVGAEIIHVAEQNGLLTLWAIINLGAEVEDRHIVIHGTGAPFAGSESDFIGTAIMRNGNVWHLFEMASAAIVKELS